MKSTFLLGSSSVINIILGIIRNKLIAILLNPSGVGLLGVYQSITNLAGTISGLGINESGARYTALAYRAGEEATIARTRLSLRRIALITGICGTILLLLSSKPISLLTFGSSRRALEISLLSVTVLFGAVSGGQYALIQGARKIKYLAKMNVLGPLYGTLLSLPIIYFWGMRAIVSYLIIMAATNIVTTWWYSKKLKIPEFRSSMRSSLSNGKPLLTLGAALMVGNLAGVATQYLLRVLIIRFLDLNAAGEYQASAILSSVYVGILLNAMATDFYPRLSAASDNDKECGNLVNKQIHTGLLIAAPGVVATLTFVHLIIVQLYSKHFVQAPEVLKWQILGVFLSVVTWPMGYVFRAKADGKLFVATELFAGFSYLALAWVGIQYFGLPGTGLAFFVRNAVYAILIYRIIHRKYGFSLSPTNVHVLLLFSAAIGATFLSPYVLGKSHLILSIGIILGVSAYCIRSLALYSVLSRFLSRLRKAG